MATLPIGPHRVEAMLTYLLDISKKMLEANGAFFPFGAIIDAAGNRMPVTGDTGKPNAKTHEVYDLIATSMRAQFRKGEIVAGAIVAEASMPPELKPDYPDGVRIVVESNSISRVVFLPVRKAMKPKPGEPAMEYGELIGVNVRPTIFTEPPEV